MKRMWSKNELLRLSDAEIKKLIESGEIDNAKPIYLHSITLIGAAALPNIGRLTCFILNNDDTPFTSETFLDYVDNLYQSAGENVRIMTSGGVVVPSGGDYKTLIASCFGRNVENYFITGVYTDNIDGSQTYSRAQFLSFFTSLFDGINRLN